MARLATRKFQDLDIMYENDICTVEVFYQKRGNALGEFFIDQGYWQHKSLGEIFYRRFTTKNLQDIETHIINAAKSKAPDLTYLNFERYARKQTIELAHVSECAIRGTTDRSPLMLSSVYIAKDKQGTIWYKLRINDDPKKLENLGQMDEFVPWNEKKVEEFTKAVQDAYNLREAMLIEWETKVYREIAQKHDECTGMAKPAVTSEDNNDSLQAIINAYY